MMDQNLKFDSHKDDDGQKAIDAHKRQLAILDRYSK